MSILYKIVLFGYLALRVKQMYNHEGWSLSQQTLLTKPKELALPLRFVDAINSNTSLVIQFNQKRKKLTEAEFLALKLKKEAECRKQQAKDAAELMGIDTSKEQN